MNNFSELLLADHAISYLGDKLKKGELVLFLGAGASSGFGLPNWLKLVNSLRSELGMSTFPKKATAEDLQRGADECEQHYKDKEDFRQIVRKHLYKDLPSQLSSDVFDNHLLLSVSALLMGSKRGHVSRVVTLNYDSMLEWFLSIYGFMVKTISSLPYLDGSEDVRIYHPHGYLPHPNFDNNSSDFLILTLHSIDTRWGTPGEPWIEIIRHLLLTGVCLFVGMSGKSASDRALSPLFNHAASKVSNERPVGIWLILGKRDASKEIDFQRNNIIPHYFTDEKDIPDFLLKICQSALKSI